MSLTPASPASPCDALLASGLQSSHERRFEESVDLPWASMHPNKRLVFKTLLAGAPSLDRSLTFAKYHLAADELDCVTVDSRTRVEARADVYDYAPSAGEVFRVYVNFADENLFGFYAGGLFAQDEMQVAEHPALAMLRESARAVDPEAMRLDPRHHEVALITDVPRLGAIRGDVYGAAFARATAAALERSVTKFASPTFSNILAMAARPVPAAWEGRPYRAEDIRYHLVTALTAFAAAKRTAGARRLVVHTGNWGTGAFGNDPELMALVQIVAARAAGVDELVYHTVTVERLAAVRRAEAALRQSQATTETLSDYLHWMVSLKRPYGRGNGT